MSNFPVCHLKWKSDLPAGLSVIQYLCGIPRSLGRGTSFSSWNACYSYIRSLSTTFCAALCIRCSSQIQKWSRCLGLSKVTMYDHLWQTSCLGNSCRCLLSQYICIYKELGFSKRGFPVSWQSWHLKLLPSESQTGCTLLVLRGRPLMIVGGPRAEIFISLFFFFGCTVLANFFSRPMGSCYFFFWAFLFFQPLGTCNFFFPVIGRSLFFFSLLPEPPPQSLMVDP